MIDPGQVTACIPTRGNVDMTEILDSLAAFDEVIVYDNSKERVDYSVYGRYAAASGARNNVIYTQDDDCIVDAARVCRNYQEGILISNMPAVRWSDYPDSALVGWGAVFDVELPEAAFLRYERILGAWGKRPLVDGGIGVFFRTCDVVFSTLTPHQKIDVGFSHLPWAEGPGRMFTDDYPAHRAERDRMLALARKVRDA